jgi:hypothetical protein
MEIEKMGYLSEAFTWDRQAPGDYFSDYLEAIAILAGHPCFQFGDDGALYIFRP